MMKRKCLTTLLLAAVLLSSAGCDSEKPSENNLENILSEQYGDIFNEFISEGEETLRTNDLVETRYGNDSLETNDAPSESEEIIDKNHISNYSGYQIWSCSSDGLAVVGRAYEGKFQNGWVVVDSDGNIIYDEYCDGAYSDMNNLSVITDNILRKVEMPGTNNVSVHYINVYTGEKLTIDKNLVSYTNVSDGKIGVTYKKETISGTEYYITYYDLSFKELFTLPGKQAGDFQNGYALIIDNNDMLQMINETGEIIPWNFSGAYNVCLDYAQRWHSDAVIISVDGVSSNSNELPSFHAYNEELSYAVLPLRLYYTYQMSPGKPNYTDDVSLCFAVIYSDGYVGWFADDVSNISSFVEIGENVVSFTDVFYNFETDSYVYLSDIESLASAANYKCGVFSEGLVAINLQSSSNVSFSTVMNREGEVLFAPTSEFTFHDRGRNFLYVMTDIECKFSSGLCPAYSVEDKAWGYINALGEWVIQPIYYAVSNFNNGRAIVKLDGVSKGENYYFLIDTDGNNIW